jgi:multidrug efflux system outer membrane protein
VTLTAMNLRLRLLLPAALGLLAACTMAPHYDRPASPVPEAWSTTPAPASDGSPAPAPGAVPPIAANLGWREFFSDARLQTLIDLALRQNRDLRVAALNVEEVAAQYRIQRAALFPVIAADGSLTRTKGPSALSYPGIPNPYSVYEVDAAAVSWEVDFWGRIRSLKDQALQTYFATEESRRSVQLSLVAQVATQYFSERALAEEVALARQTLRAQEDSLHLTQRSYEVGNTSELDYQTARGQVATARSDLAALERQHAASLTALSVLVGGPLPETAAPVPLLADDGLIADLPAGLPADLLARRPDILEAEATLKGYNANIGAARAAFFPKVTLTANGGTESLSLSGLFKPGSGAWTLAPEISLPIFDAGTNLANLKIAKLQKQAAIAQYEKSIQTAFQEVSDALTARGWYDTQISAQRTLVDADQHAYTIAEARYRHGVDNYLTALDAQRTLYAAQQSLIQARQARLANLVTLYKALGGGWTEHTVAASGPAPAPAHP